MNRRWILPMAAGPICLAALGLFIYARSPRTASDAATQPRQVDRSSPPSPIVRAKLAPEVTLGEIVQEGISVRFSMTRIGGADRAGEDFLEADDVRFRFRLSDTATDKPLTSVYPAAWLVARRPGTVTSPELASKKAEALINASIFTPADIDLNVYYVLTLNSNATITVVDPLFGYGNTKLLALIQLKTPGADWAITEDETTLFVSLPESNEVAVIDTAKWEILRYVPGGLFPNRLALQPDGHYLWVAGGGYGKHAADSGVTVLNADTMEVAARIRTGPGQHDIAFSDDSRFAFVTNSQQGTVTIVDVRSMRVLADVATGDTPVSIDFSTVGQVAYVSHSGDGSIAVVSGNRAKVVARLQADEGLGQIRFAAGGRYGFVVNTKRDLVHIVDAASSRIVQTGEVRDGPDQIAFSDDLAYVRHRGSPDVLMIPLDAIGGEEEPIPLVECPAGQSPAGQMSRPCLAPSMVQAPGASAMLIANPSDEAVYFYKEGMAAPMGTFSNYRREPLAVAVVDRSLAERSAPGVYETVARLQDPGSYDVVFFLDAPRIVHCFPLEVQADPEKERLRNEGKFDIEHIVDAPHLRVGQSTQVGFRITDRNSGAPRSGLNDVVIQTFLVPNWHARNTANEIEPGVYAIDFTPPRQGTYYISIASTAIGLTHSNPQLLVIQAVNEKSGTPDTRKDAETGRQAEIDTADDNAESSNR